MMKNLKSDIRFAFFGTSHIAVYVLEALEKAELLPDTIVTTPDQKRGRGLKLTASPVKEWASIHAIPVLDPEMLDEEFFKKMREQKLHVAVVVDYGKILPAELLAIPKRGFLNIHPSLLPRFRGPSPMRSAILNDEHETGVSIILLDEEMDHGPIVAQKKVSFGPPAGGWPIKNSELERVLLQAGGQLLAQILPEWVAGRIEAREQNHDIATYCEKIEKEDGLLDLNDDARKNLLKIRAFEGWPSTYTFFERGEKKIRVQILEARIENTKLIIERVKPEGKKEMAYAEFLRSGAVLAR